MDEILPPPPAPESRSPFGWIVLFVLFGYLIFGATTRPPSDSEKARIARYNGRLQTAMATYQAGDHPVTKFMTGEVSATAPLRKLERDVAARRRTEPLEATVWATVRLILGERIEAKDLAVLKKDPHYALFSQAYGAKGRTEKESAALVKQLQAGDGLSKAAADIVRREAGLPSPVKSAKRNLVAGLIFLALIFGSGFAWLMTLVYGVAGELRSLGPAIEVRTGAEADRLALRAAILLSLWVVLQVVAQGLVYAGVNVLAAQVLLYATMVALVPQVLRASPSMAEVGLGFQNLSRHVFLGLWAFLLELPVTGTIAIVCAILLRNLPPPEHPAATALSSSPDIWTIAVTFIGGAIVAPFWEETMFRGLFFPALRKVIGGPIPAALLSSFLFASIHPQGPVLWAALASVALFSCVLAQRTRSLVPSVVMHFAHNAALLTITVMMGGG